MACKQHRGRRRRARQVSTRARPRGARAPCRGRWSEKAHGPGVRVSGRGREVARDPASVRGHAVADAALQVRVGLRSAFRVIPFPSNPVTPFRVALSESLLSGGAESPITAAGRLLRAGCRAAGRPRRRASGPPGRWLAPAVTSAAEHGCGPPL